MKKQKGKRKVADKVGSGKTAAPKSNAEKWLWAGLAGITVAGVGYFGWKYFNGKQNAAAAAADALPSFNWPVAPQPATPPSIPPVTVYRPEPKPRPHNRPAPENTATDSFPLKKGSKGGNVEAFQQALINTYGKDILPRYGADGQFGTEMAAALKKLKLPARVDLTTFNIIVKGGGNPQGSQNAAEGSIAKNLIDAAGKKDFPAAIKALRQINGTDGYTAVNTLFKNMRINGGVRQTLVNGMLNAFADEKQKREIRLEFQRMGLIYDGSKWSLSGLDGLTIVTIDTATVWADANKSVQVPKRTVLGTEIARRLDYTLFENKGKHFLVQTSKVTYL